MKNCKVEEILAASKRLWKDDEWDSDSKFSFRVST